MHTASVRTSRWLPPYFKPVDEARVRLFCFPYAGGGASVFLRWAARLAPAIEVCPIQMPGRENRVSEPCISSVPEVCDAIIWELGHMFSGRFAFFGHSLGALVAYEVAQRLARRGMATPDHLIMSGHRAPQVPYASSPTWNLPEHEFRARLLELQGTPKEVLEDEALASLLIPLLRADFCLDETYVHPHDHRPLSCPVTVFGGTRDSEIPEADLLAWRNVTSGPFQMNMFAGDHFFIHSCAHSVMDTTAALLR